MSEEKKSYSVLMQDPRWQRKRLEIMERDKFTCQSCFDKTSPLNVHHQYYLPDTMPWEYPDRCYILLCDKCHNLFHSSFQNKNMKPYYSASGKPDGTYTVTQTNAFLLSNYIDKVVQEYGNNGFKHLIQTALCMIIKEEDL